MPDTWTFSQLERCRWCGAHLIGIYEPVNISTITDREQVFVRGYEHVCPGERIDGCPPAGKMEP